MSEIVRIVAFVRPHRMEQVKTAVASLGVSGITVSDVRGTGNSAEASAWFAGERQFVAMPIKSKIVTVAPAEMAEEIVQAIVENARTGEPGDGKVFVEPIENAVRIRTCETGLEAV